MVPSVPTVKLNSGYEIPVVGLGTWKSDVGKVEDAVKTALECGYRHIDCAKVYGNEAEVGRGIKGCLDAGTVKREDIFVTSKLAVWRVRETDHARDDVKKACLKSMSDLQLDYLDLYLIHWPVTLRKGPTLEPPIPETWEAMENLVHEGLVRTIGVSNFPMWRVKEMLEYCKIVPAVNQVEMHPYLRQDELLAFCNSKGIHVTAYAPLGTPDSAEFMKRDVSPDLLNDSRVAAIAQKLGKTNAQVLIRWSIQHGTSVIPKSVTPSRIKSNLEVLDWELSKEDYDALASFDIEFRFLQITKFFIDPEGPYKTLTEFWGDPDEETMLEKYIQSLSK